MFSYSCSFISTCSVDRRLGTIDEFKQVVKALHDNGIRVVLDGVFNHTGIHHAAFQSRLVLGSNSEYYTWYTGKNWEGHENLPVLNLENVQVRQMIFSVARFWLSDVGIDGWRLDVAHEIKPSFWQEVCLQMKCIHAHIFSSSHLLISSLA
jgi:glycosidase